MDFFIGLLVGFGVGVAFAQWWEATQNLPDDFNRP